MSETIEFYGHTLVVYQSDKTRRWHGAVHYPEGRYRWDTVTQKWIGTEPQHMRDMTRAGLMRKLQGCVNSSLRRRAHGREQEKAAAPLKLDPVLVGKLLGLLASDTDGDVLAAARALTDELKRCDLSPEALAARIAKE